MIKGKFNVVVDGNHGSCGKGLISSYLTIKHKPEFLTNTNMANAGHTVVDSDGKSFMSKVLPSPAIYNKWSKDYNGTIKDYHPTVIIGSSSAFTIDRFKHEVDECDLAPETTWIHPRAGVILDTHKTKEESLTEGTKAIASTMQGCGAFLAEKVLRHAKLAFQYDELKDYVKQTNIPAYLMDGMNDGLTILHEGSQGFSLDINHGSDYPNCTSRQTTATQCLADMGLPVRSMGDVYLVIRSYPIRVGNVIENGVQVGYSGGHYSDSEEIDWRTVAAESGMPQSEAEALFSKELTTVTKRLRRVFRFSAEQIKLAAAINGTTKIALNFANYIDWNIANTNDVDKLMDSIKVLDFINRIEDITQVPVTLIGTGPQVNHVIDLNEI